LHHKHSNISFTVKLVRLCFRLEEPGSVGMKKDLLKSKSSNPKRSSYPITLVGQKGPRTSRKGSAPPCTEKKPTSRNWEVGADETVGDGNSCPVLYQSSIDSEFEGPGWLFIFFSYESNTGTASPLADMAQKACRLQMADPS
jgi:hypothetical protein